MECWSVGTLSLLHHSTTPFLPNFMKHRLLRVNELLKRELSSIITREISFDGALVTLNQVDVTPDLKHAHAYVSVLGVKERTAVIEKLEENRVVLQTALAKSVTLKYTPHLVFH